MKETYPINALVISRHPFRERDARVIVFSKEKGKVDLVARGTASTKSKLASHIEPITLANIMVIPGKRYNYIGSSITQVNNVNLKQSYEAIKAAGRGVRIFNELIKWEVRDNELYHLLSSFFEILNSKSIQDPEFITDSFVFKLISILGYSPELDKCIECSQEIEKKKLFFDLSKSGLICEKCLKRESQYSISLDCVKILKFISKNEFSQIAKIRIYKNVNKGINQFVDKYYNNLFH